MWQPQASPHVVVQRAPFQQLEGQAASSRLPIGKGTEVLHQVGVAAQLGLDALVGHPLAVCDCHVHRVEAGLAAVLLWHVGHLDGDVAAVPEAGELVHSAEGAVAQQAVWHGPHDVVHLDAVGRLPGAGHARMVRSRSCRMLRFSWLRGLVSAAGLEESVRADEAWLCTGELGCTACPRPESSWPAVRLIARGSAVEPASKSVWLVLVWLAEGPAAYVAWMRKAESSTEGAAM